MPITLGKYCMKQVTKLICQKECNTFQKNNMSNVLSSPGQGMPGFSGTHGNTANGGKKNKGNKKNCILKKHFICGRQAKVFICAPTLPFIMTAG